MPVEDHAQPDHSNTTLFQAAVENSYDVITVMQEDGTILFESPSFSQVLGFEIEDVLGTNAFDLVHPEDLPLMQQELAQALKQGRGEVSTYRCRTQSGEWRWLKSTGALLSHDSPPTFVVNSRDVTEHIQAKEAQEKASRDILTIWESITDAFFALDEQWNVCYVNAQGERLLRRKREELLGKNLWQEFPEAVGSAFYQQYQRAVREQVPVEFEAFYPPLNTWFEVHAYPSNVGLSVYFRNINERKQADFALRESEERFRRIFEEGPLGIAVVGTDSKLLHANPRLCKMLGYSEPELKEVTVAGVTHPDDVDADADLARQLFAGEILSYQIEKRYLTKEGQVVWGSLTGSLIRDENGQPLYALGIVEDITARKQAEQALRESEARLLNAQTIAHLGYLEMKAATGESCWSDETFRILGVEPQSFEPDVQQVLERVHPEDLTRATQSARELFEQGKAFDIEHRIVRPDGEVRWVQARAEVIESENGQPRRFASTLLDITERKHAEETQARLAAIVESSHDAILSVDKEGVITFWNPAAERLFGYSADEVIGESISVHWPAERMAEAREIFTRIRQSEQVQQFETERIHKHGHRIPVSLTISPMVDGNGGITGFSAIVRDIREQRRANEAQARLAAIVESSKDAILSADFEGVVTSWNPAAEQLYGYSAQEAIGQHLSFLLPPERVHEVAEIRQRLQRGEHVTALDTERLHKDGHRVPISLSVSPLQDATGQIVGTSSIARDVTERKQAEEALRYSQRLYHTLAHNFPNGGVYLLDREARVILAEGRGLADVGLSPTDLQGKNPREIWDDPELYGKLQTGYHKALEGEEPTFEVEVRGRMRLVRMVPVRDGGHEITHVLSMTQDITERKRAEEALRHSEASLARAQSIAHLGYLELDKTTGRHFWSEETYRIFGVEPHSIEPSFERFLEFVHPEDRGVAARAGESLFQHNRGFDVEHRVVRLDGEVRWVRDQAEVVYDANQKVSRYVCTLLDITERQHAEETQARLAAIVESSDDAIISKTLEGIITSWNRGAEQVYGYIAAEAMGRHMSMLLPPDRHQEEEDILQRLRSGERIHHFETQRVRRDGQLIDVSLSSSPMFNAAGEVIAASSIARDITAQKQAEAEQERFFSLSLDLLCTFDEQGIFRRVNPAFEQVLGYAPDELIGQSFLDYLHPEDRVASEKGIEQLASGHAVTDFVNRYRCRDGSYKSILWATAPYGNIFYATGRDITAMRAAEEERERSLALLQATLESTADGILVVNNEGRITHYNQQFLGMWDIPDEVIQAGDNAKTIDFVKEQLINPAEFEATAHSLPGDPEQEGFDLLHFKDGRVFERYSKTLHVREQGVGRVWSFRDITAQKQAQAEQSRLAALLEATVDYVGWADTKGYVQYLNPAGRAMIGLSPNESVEGRSITELSPAWANDIIVKVGIPTASLQGSWSGETALLHRDGQEIPVSQVITAHKDANGQNIFYSTIARDISESKRVQKILQRANEELEERVQERTAELATINHQLQGEVVERKMAAGALRQVVEMLEQAQQESDAAKEEAEQANHSKSEFLSRMSHELRTPLNAILGFAQILEMRELGPKESRGVQQIIKAGRHLLQLINEVLEISRIEAGRISLSIEPVEVLPLLQEVSNLVQPLAAQQNIILLNELTIENAPSGGWFVRADRQRLQQVLLNLLSNAIKYNHQGGSVILSLQESTAIDGDGNEGVEGEGTVLTSLRIAVRDTGPGISQEDQQKIFVPFERLGAESTKIEGTGIGLTLVKRLMELMHGQIGIDSQLGQGSTFWIELPVAESPGERLHRLHPQPASTVTSRLAINRQVTVLYIEDNASNLSLLEDVFEEMPQVRLLSAIQGRLGLELARQHRPDLVLLDLHLPDIQGDEVLQQLQADSATSHIPVVMLSADATPNQIERLLAAGARYYLTKPLDIKQLVQVLENLLEEQP
jgi:PAS domain S-box-containing protein